jgi:hypothetical protein
MPFYYSLWRQPTEIRKRTAEGLKRLTQQFADEGIPERTVSGTLLLATWNIREFDSAKYGERCAECFYYIAEIINRFDLVAIQEVREDLWALDRVQEILGGWWKYIVTDVTEGTAGNRERMAFMYDSRKVTFGGLAGEIVLPEAKNGPRVLQFARTPFICGFKAGWTKFNLCTVHIYYGEGVRDDPRRIEEIEELANLLAKRAKLPEQPARPDGKVTAVRNTEPDNLILLGDFNIFDRADVTMEKLTDAGFVVPDELTSLSGSNIAKNRHYDQIAFMTRPNRFGTTGKAGVFDFYVSVFRDDEGPVYAGLMDGRYEKAANPTRAYKDWRTYQMSDHLLLWVELKTDFSDAYLDELATAPDRNRGAEPAHSTAAGTARKAGAREPAQSHRRQARAKEAAVR